MQRHLRSCSRFFTAAVFSLSLLLSLAFGVSSAAAVTGGTPVTLPFPRVSMWWPDSDAQPAADRARYDWIQLRNADAHHIAELRNLNPDMLILTEGSARELPFDPADRNSPTNADIKRASFRWILTQVGSTLTASVDSAQTSLPVVNGSLFRTGDILVLDEELAIVTGIGGNTLYVQRGVAKAPTSHAGGARVAPAVSAWRNTVTFDVSANCPTVNVGNGAETWASFNARIMLEKVRSADWDGIVVDSFTADPSWFVRSGIARSIDPSRTNVAPASYAQFDTEWNTGMSASGDVMRATMGSNVIIVPNCGVRSYALNGKNFENFPRPTTTPDIWRIVVFGPWGYSMNESYLDWLKYGAKPNLSTIQTYEYDGSLPSGWRNGFVPNYQKMRFGLATALMGDGFYAWEVSMYGHGTLGLYWFDEFDNAGKQRGYLGQPTGAAREVATNVFRRDYEGGIALVNPDTVAHTVALGGIFRKIKGTQAPSVNNGQLVDSVTLQPQDGIVLLRDTATSVPNYPQPLYRFYNTRTGTHFYTASAAERDQVISSLSWTFRFEGAVFSVYGAAADTKPVYRFFNMRNGTHFYTADENEKNNVLATLGSIYKLEGAVFYVPRNGTGMRPVYRFFNVRTGTHFYTADPAERDNVISGLSGIYRYEGVVFYAAP